MNKHSLSELQLLQGLPLDAKVAKTKARIREWVYEYGIDEVSVSFSGGKDSTVLLTIARELFPEIKAVFFDTGLEYPEIRDFVKTWDNVDWIKPKMNFKKVIEKYGYPFISKEVSECVYGARKYLTYVENQLNLDRPTDRPTDRPETMPIDLKSCADSASLAKMSGGVRQEIQKDKRHRGVCKNWAWNKLHGIGRYGTQSNTVANTELGGAVLQGTSQTLPAYESTRAEHSMLHSGRMNISNTQFDRTMEGKRGGVMPLGDSERLQESLRLKTLLTQDFQKTIDTYRVQRLMGILPLKGKATAETIPSKKSMYSCERYQFFLDAPFEISNKCCNVMKKSPSQTYIRQTGRHPMTAQLASESKLRTQQWLKNGCNGFDMKHPISNPMSFWTEQDVLLYLYLNHIPIASVYGEIVKDTEVDGQLDLADLGLFDLGNPVLKTTGAYRTGCMFCGYGCHLEKSPNRFERMKLTHPNQYEYIMKPWDEGGLGYKEVIDWINEHGNMNIKY